MTRSTNRCPATLSFTLALLALTGCMSGGEPGDGSYPLAAADLCDRAEGSECDARTFEEACALTDDFTRACRCVSDDAAGARGIVVCDGRTPVPPLPTYCADDVVAGGSCTDAEAGRVCGREDGGRCICSENRDRTDADPASADAVDGLSWVCELPPPSPGSCPPGVERGGVCLGSEGTYCTIGDAARCRCIDDPWRDGLPVWECEGSTGGGDPGTCDATMAEGDRCAPDLVGTRCSVDGRICGCAGSPDGSEGGIWTCSTETDPPVSSCDGVRLEAGALCDAIGARCATSAGEVCECGRSADGEDRAVWTCSGTIEPAPLTCDTLGAYEGARCEPDRTGSRCESDSQVCECGSADGSVEGAVWHCREITPPTEPRVCPFSPYTDAIISCEDIGASCLWEDRLGTCYCVESSDPSVPPGARGTWRCEGATTAEGDR